MLNVTDRKLRLVRLDICGNILISLRSECLMIEILVIKESILHLVFFKMILINVWLV